MDNILERQILINKIEKTLTSTGKQLIKVRDANNLGYQLWPIKADGTESKAYQFFKGLQMDGIGINVMISFKEEQSEYQGKPVTYRTIIGMKPVPMVNNATPTPKIAPQGKLGVKMPTVEPDWQSISWGKCKHAFLVEAFKIMGKECFDNEQVINWNKIERDAERWADMSMRKTNNIKQNLEMAGVNTKEVDISEIRVDEIPF